MHSVSREGKPIDNAFADVAPLASSQARKVVFDEVQSFAKGKATAGQELTVNEIATLQKSLRKKLLMTEVSAIQRHPPPPIDQALFVSITRLHSPDPLGGRHRIHLAFDGSQCTWGCWARLGRATRQASVHVRARA